MKRIINLQGNASLRAPETNKAIHRTRASLRAAVRGEAIQCFSYLMTRLLHRRLRLLLAMTLSLFSLSLHADSLDFYSLLNQLHTMKANIVQTVYDNHGRAVQTAYGDMALSRPGQFRWEIKKPIPQLIIVNDDKVTIYDPDLEQVVIRSLKKQGEVGALMLSDSHVNIEKHYQVSQLKSDKKNWQWFSLQPHQEEGMLVNIEIGFYQGVLQTMVLKDHLGHTTRIIFQDIKINTPLVPSLFIFPIPPHTDVIHN